MKEASHFNEGSLTLLKKEPSACQKTALFEITLIKLVLNCLVYFEANILTILRHRSSVLLRRALLDLRFINRDRIKF